MSFAALRKHAVALPGATEDIKWGSDWVASVGGKMFFVGGREPQNDWSHCSFKVEEHRFLEISGLPGFMPAPYAARYHWVALKDPKALPLAELKALLSRSHELVAAKLTKKTRIALGIPT